MRAWVVFLILSFSFSGAQAYRDEIPNYGQLFTPATTVLSVQPIGESRVQDHLGNPLTVSRLTSPDVQAVFSWLQLSNLPFAYPKDCCHSRAYLMGQWLAERGVFTVEIFVVGHLSFQSPIYGKVPWEFHVAPAVQSERGEWMILDPSTLHQAASLSEWLQKFTPAKGYKVYVTSRWIYGDQNLMNPPPPFFSEDLENIAQGELMGCESALKNSKR